MKLLVFSDTHNAARRMPAVVREEQGVHAAFFLGDGSRDADLLAEEFPALPLYRVAGNCDYGSLDPHQGLAPFGGLLVFYTHGHSYGVKGHLGGLLRAARHEGADIALFGHTHTPHHELADGIHLFNPGSLSIPRGSGPPTYGVITIENAVPHFEIKPYGG